MTFKQKVTTFAAAVGGALSVAPSAFAQTLNDTANIAVRGQFNGLNNIRPSQFIAAVINLILGGAGVIAFIFLLWGGLQWILAGGDKEGTEKARKKITSALIGLAIVFSAYALLFIIRALFGIDVIQVELKNIQTY